MARSECKQRTLGLWVLDFARKEGKGKGMGGRTCRMLVAGEPLVEELPNWKGGAPLPAVAARKRRPRERERERERERSGGRSVEAKEKRKVRPR